MVKALGPGQAHEKGKGGKGERHRGKKEVAAGGRDGDGKVYTGLIPITLCTRLPAHMGLHTQLGTHHCQHTGPTVHTLDAHIQSLSGPTFQHSLQQTHKLK